jgi:pimeloyl-ACP methyl ester carboxylesterase
MLAGHSYGTYLGETLAAMFPERVERMVLDAVLNPHEYRDGW